MKYVFTIFVLLIFFASSTLIAQIEWIKHSNPVLTPGPTGAWDEEFVAFPSVLFDGSSYHMWYGNYNYITYVFEKIGYATSADGITWIKYNDSTTTNKPYALSDPVLVPGPSGSPDDIGVRTGCVLMINNLYHMWYVGDDEPAVNAGNSICHATSTDGITWERNLNNPVLDVGVNGTWDDSWVEAPSVVFDGSVYHLWYCAADRYTLNQVRIGHATSPHPDSSWTKDPNNPVLTFGVAGKWDYDTVEAPNVIFDGSRFHMWYSGGYILEWRIGYAWSEDGSNWKKYNDPSTTSNPYIHSDPVLSWGDPGAFDDVLVSHCSVILDTVIDSLKMWYTAGDTINSCQVGYATALIIYESLFDYEVLEQLEVQFTDSSIGIITSWLWNFGDGNTSTDINPLHTYNQAGNYTVTLKVSGLYGSDSSTQQIIVTGLEENKTNISLEYTLNQNYPNPFNPTTTLEFSIPKTEFVSLKIYNLLGQEVATLVSDKLTPGDYTYTWDASGFASGVYFFKLNSTNFSQIRKMILLR
jgi:PKD repeat protein